MKMQTVVKISNETKHMIYFIYNKITDVFDDFKFK